MNIASRVQGLATSREILTTGLLERSGLSPVSQNASLRGITNEVTLYAIP